MTYTNKTNACLPILAALFVLAACKNNNQGNPITGDEIKRHIAVLADDSLQGRKSFTPGEIKAINYISSEFKKEGLEPGNNGSFFQDVPMVEITSMPAAGLTISGGKSNITLNYITDFVASTRQELPDVQLNNSPLVFAGYGVVAPEYHWDDYAGLDVKGKTVVILVNDPGNEAAKPDPKFFKGKAMTYYGRWTYKYEEAARHGAAAAIIVHETVPAAYGWEVVRNSWSGAQMLLETKDKNASLVAVQAW